MLSAYVERRRYEQIEYPLGVRACVRACSWVCQWLLGHLPDVPTHTAVQGAPQAFLIVQEVDIF